MMTPHRFILAGTLLSSSFFPAAPAAAQVPRMAAQLKAAPLEASPSISHAMAARTAEDPAVALQRLVAPDLDRVIVQVALEEIARQADLRLAYLPEILPRTKRVSLQAQRITAAAAFERVLAGTRLGIQVGTTGHVVVVRHPRTGTAAPRRAVERRMGTIMGTVISDEGEGLPGASVQIVGTDLSTITDARGRFSFPRVLDGSHQVTTSYIGYQEGVRQVTVSAGQDSDVTLELTPQAIAIEGLTVLGKLSQGQAKALQQQKNASNIQNVISGEQIHRFPDRSAAEAVKRLPGLYNHRDDGEGTTVYIRGLAPAFNQVTINGQTAANPESDRGNRLDVISADLIKRITVTRALTPEMDGSAIGGSVDFELAEAPERPLVSFGLEYGYTNNPSIVSSSLGNDKQGGRLALGRRFLDDQLGVLLSGSYNRYDGGYLFDKRWYQSEDGSSTDELLERRQHQDRDTRRVRSGLVGNLDYRFNPDHRIHLVGSFSGYDYQKTSRLLDVRRQVRKGKVEVTDNLELRNFLIERRTEMTELGGDHQLGAAQLDYSLTASRSGRATPNGTKFLFERSNPVLADASNSEWLGFQLGSDPVSGLDPYTLAEVVEDADKTQEVLRGAEANLRIPIAFGGGQSNVKVGGKVLVREKDNEPTFKWRGAPEERIVLEGITAYDDIDYRSASYQSELRPGLSGEEETQADRVEQFFEVTEQVAAAYAQAELHLSDRLMTLFGARVERTGGEMMHLTVPEPTEREYLNVLPSFHVRYRFSPGTQLRFAATTGIARPDFVDLAPYLIVDKENFVLERGNPGLEPTTARNLDLMFETYSSSLGLFSAGVFAKWLDNQIYGALSTEDYQGREYEVEQPVNGEQAEVFGAELALSRRLDFMPEALAFLRPFSVFANYTLTHTEQILGKGEARRTLPLDDVPEHMGNLALTYDNPGIGLEWTLSGNYRGQELRGPGTTRFGDRWLDAETSLDFSASKMLFGNVSLFLTANNLLDTHERIIYEEPVVRLAKDEWFGRTYSVAVRYRY